MSTKSPLILQFTGLSGAGKTTLALKFRERVVKNSITAAVIDGDAYRKTYCKDLGFSKADRLENIRRLGLLASMREEEIIVIAAINPFEEGRTMLKSRYGALVIYLECDMDTLISRDTKGLYRRAMLAAHNPERIDNLTGVNDPFEIPAGADLILNTAQLSDWECLERLTTFVKFKLSCKKQESLL